MKEEYRKSLQEAVERTKSIIGEQSAKPDEVLDLVKVLHRDRKFGLARRLLDLCSKTPEVKGNPEYRLKFAQKFALSTYKDPDLQSDLKLERALSILQETEDLASTKDQETLGLAGAIHKKMWEQTSQEKHLHTSLGYYLRGYREGVGSDYGYTAINAAFILDILADIERSETPLTCSTGSSSMQRLEKARAIREDIVATLPGLISEKEWLSREWWFLVTLGEAYFGLGKYGEAENWLLQAKALENVPDWEYESTARQMAFLLRLAKQEAACGGKQIDSDAGMVLRKFLDNNYEAVDSVIRGKIGLALSGGGFRASLYHIGVLARLAELDLLRHVEYISCVSGGSIIGAHLYLELRKLLQENHEKCIDRNHYLDIVDRIAARFLRGVQKNIRTRIAAEWRTNFKMMFVSDYSRTMRAGELYEEEIFSKVDDNEGDKKRWLNNLKIIPKGETNEFAPKDNNWRRSAKVPILILNATCLNTGHNWQFTASWMGEPPAGIDSEVDANYRLRRMYYEEAPEPHKNVRLGYAVAASACVPGIFEPLTLANLYERLRPGKKQKVRPVVRLVDGGVYDNQGVAALLEQGCSILLVSDASGQMDSRDFPSSGLLGVPLRSNSILQARVRVSQFLDLDGRRRAGLLRGLMFVHLKKDLETENVDWINCTDPSTPERQNIFTSYGVLKTVQLRLSAIRTDLDSFSETEAYALMTSGYLMTEHALKEPILGFDVEQKTPKDWTFLQIGHLLKQSGLSASLLKQLKVADKLFFKVWLLLRPLQIIGGLAVLLALILMCYLAYEYRTEKILTLTINDAFWVGGITAIALMGPGILSRVIDYRKTVQEMLIGLGMAVFGALVARLHLHVFDRLFLAQGRLKRLLAKSGGPEPRVEIESPQIAPKR